MPCHRGHAMACHGYDAHPPWRVSADRKQLTKWMHFMKLQWLSQSVFNDMHACGTHALCTLRRDGLPTYRLPTAYHWCSLSTYLPYIYNVCLSQSSPCKPLIIAAVHDVLLKLISWYAWICSKLHDIPQLPNFHRFQRMHIMLSWLYVVLSFRMRTLPLYESHAWPYCQMAGVI